MGNIYFTRLFRHSTLWITACSFIGGSLAAPLRASYEFETQVKAVNLNDVAFIARIEKLYEKVKRYKDKLESEKIIETMFDIKMEVGGIQERKLI